MREFSVIFRSVKEIGEFVSIANRQPFSVQLLYGSTVLDAKAPMMLARNFQPGGKLSINMKDIKNVLATAHQADVPLPLSAGLYEIMTSLKNMGCLDNDHSGIVKFYERLAGVEVRPQ